MKVSLRRPVVPELRSSKPIDPDIAESRIAKFWSGTWAIEGDDLIQTELVQKAGARLVLGDKHWSNYDLSFQALSFGRTQRFNAIFHFTQPHILWNFGLGSSL